MYVSVEASRLTFPEGAVLFGLVPNGMLQIGLVAAPFCRARELATHYLLSELPFLGCAPPINFELLAPAMRPSRLTTFVLGDLFRRSGVSLSRSRCKTRQAGLRSAVRSYRPRACFRMRPPTPMQQLKLSTKSYAAEGLAQLGKGPLPSSPAGQLWNEHRPLMFLWLPNANSGAQERASWQAVALCRRIKRRRFNSRDWLRRRQE